MPGWDLTQLHLYTKYGAMGTQPGETTSIVATPATVTFTQAGQTEQISVENQKGDVLTQYLTYSSNNAKTTVSASGLITSVTSGTSTITVTYSEPNDTPLTDTISVTTTVTNIVTIVGNSSPYSLHEDEYLSLTTKDQANTDITYDCLYYSSDESVAIFELIDNPTVRFLTSGTSTLSAVHELTQKTGTTALTLTDELITSLTSDPLLVVFDVTGTTDQLTITDQLTHDVTSKVTFSSDDEGVATVTAGGLVEGISVGTCTITVSKAYPVNTVTTTVEVSYTA